MISQSVSLVHQGLKDDDTIVVIHCESNSKAVTPFQQVKKRLEITRLVQTKRNDKRKRQKAPLSRNLKRQSRLGKSQGIPLDFKVKFKRNLSRQKLGNTKRKRKVRKVKRDYRKRSSTKNKVV